MQSTRTNTYSKLVNDLLLRVQKPGQYLGIELGHLIDNEVKNQSRDLSGQALKKWSDAKATLGLIYPD